MKKILYILSFFLGVGVIGIAQEQAQVQFSIKIADFQAVSVLPSKNSEEQMVKVIGTSSYELSVNLDKNEMIHSNPFVDNTAFLVESQNGVEVSYNAFADVSVKDQTKVVYYNVMPY